MNKNFYTQWREVVSEYADKIALSDENREWGFRELDERAVKVAAFLQSGGLQRRCIPVMIENKADHIAVIIGILLSGNYYFSIRKEQLLYFQEEFGNLNAPLVIIEDRELNLVLDSTLNLIKLVDIQGIVGRSFEPVELLPTDGFALFTTSGSTGKPKQVLHSHECIMEDTLRQIEDNGLTSSDRRDFLGALEFSASLATIFPALLSGATLIMYPLAKYGVLSLPDFWKKHAISFTSVAVSTLRIVCKHFDNLHQLTGLRFICVGSEPYSKEDLLLFQSKLPKQVTMQIAYATTETRTISERKIKLNELISAPNYSVGKVVENRQVRLVDEEGKLVKTGEIGEIVVIAKAIPDSYLNDRTATKKAYSKLEDGAVRYATGDLGYFDVDNQLHWYGRKDFVVKINGQKVNLLETEALLNSSPSVEEAAVIVDANQRMLAFFTVGVGFERERFLDEISPRIPAQLLPDQWIELDTMPKTPTGKINRKELHGYSEVAVDEEERVVDEAQGDSITIIKQIWKQELSLRQEVKDEADFFNDLGGDSLTCEVCLAEVEKQLRIKLPEGTAFTYTTPRSLVDFIEVYEKEAVICIPLTNYDSTKPNLYFVPPYPADRRMYHRFEEAFALKYNLFFVYYNPVSLENDLVPLDILLEKMADEISDSKVSTILGFSFGGILAYFLSLKLHQKNRAVNRLILLDTPMYQPFNKYESGWNFVKRLGRKAILFLKSPAVLFRYTRDFGGVYKEYKENFISEKQKENAFHPAQIIWHYIQSFPSFGAIDSGIVLFQSENPSVFQYQIKPDFRWKRYTKGKFDRFILKGAHYEVLSEEENIELMIKRILELN